MYTQEAAFPAEIISIVIPAEVIQHSRLLIARACGLLPQEVVMSAARITRFGYNPDNPTFEVPRQIDS